LAARLAQLLGEIGPDTRELVRRSYRTHKDAVERGKKRAPIAAFVPIWMDPLMTIHGDTFISDMLATVGATNVFADRKRLFPLAADIGRAEPLPAHRTEGRDTRYPRVTFDEVIQRHPEIILLPDEPYAFGESERAAFAALEIPAARTGRIHLCHGRDLMWPGLRSVEGIERLAALVEGLRD